MKVGYEMITGKSDQERKLRFKTRERRRKVQSRSRWLRAQLLVAGVCEGGSHKISRIDGRQKTEVFARAGHCEIHDENRKGEPSRLGAAAGAKGVLSPPADATAAEMAVKQDLARKKKMVEMKLEQSIGQLKQADQVLVFDCMQVVNPLASAELFWLWRQLALLGRY